MTPKHPCPRCDGNRTATRMVVILCDGYDRAERLCTKCAKDVLLFDGVLDGWDWWDQRSDRLAKVKA